MNEDLNALRSMLRTEANMIGRALISKAGLIGQRVMDREQSLVRKQSL